MSEIKAWLEREMPSPAIVIRHVEDLEAWGLVKYERGYGYRRTREGTRLLQSLREISASTPQ